MDNQTKKIIKTAFFFGNDVPYCRVITTRVADKNFLSTRCRKWHQIR